MSSSVPHPQKAIETFRSLDTKKTGFITPKQLRKALKTLLPNASEHEIKNTMINVVCDDKGRIELPAFLSLFAPKKPEKSVSFSGESEKRGSMRGSTANLSSMSSSRSSSGSSNSNLTSGFSSSYVDVSFLPETYKPDISITYRSESSYKPSTYRSDSYSSLNYCSTESLSSNTSVSSCSTEHVLFTVDELNFITRTIGDELPKDRIKDLVRQSCGRENGSISYEEFLRNTNSL